MCTFTATDGPNAPRLIHQFVPRLAAMGDDVVVAFADAVESQSPRRNCQTLSTGFNSGNRSGCGRRLVLAGTSRLPEVPSSLVENEDGVSVGEFHRKAQRRGRTMYPSVSKRRTVPPCQDNPISRPRSVIGLSI